MHTTDKAEIFEQLCAALKEYSPPYEPGVDTETRYDLWAEHGPYQAFGKERKDVYFGGVMIQSSYVGLYFMPVYSDPEAMKRIFSERLLKTLKGKSCFHIKTLDDEMLADIKHALKAGFEVYKERGWV